MSITAPTVPHFAFPFSLHASAGAAVVEQDSYEDVVACVGAVVSCPVASCPELPTFGIPDPTFQNAPPNPAGVVAAVQQWEPRADETATVTALDSTNADWAIALTSSITGTGQ